MLNMSESDWNLLLGRIKAGKCTPFLGAGACSGVFPLGSDIAKEWALEHGYPLEDSRDLARVAQYVAVTTDSMAPKEKIQREFQKFSLPDFTSVDEPHRVLADLPFPIYMTTNYDDSMMSALKSRNKEPKLELCRWNTYLTDNEKSFFEENPDYSPSVANPVVFHLHGHMKVPESLVLTEDDYLDFLINISRDQNLLPVRIRKAMAGTTLLFLGYRLGDWDFRVLFRGIVGYLEKALKRVHISVQIAPDDDGITKAQQEKVQKYLEDYFKNLDVRVYWGSCREFAAELRRRWEVYNDGN
jgi:hypothetical protein